MPATIALSEAAVATLRLRIRGFDLPVNERRLDAYRELAAAGIMEPEGGEFKFTDEGWSRREDWLAAGEAHLRSLEPRLPEYIELSDAARNVLRRHLAGDRDVTRKNLPAYRELAAAGIMDPVSTFIGGPESLFRFTRQGWERRHELQRPLARRSASAIARSLVLAISRMFSGVSAAR